MPAPPIDPAMTLKDDPFSDLPSASARRGLLLHDTRIRGVILQALLAVAIIAFFGWIVANTVANINRLNLAAGFGFLWQRAGFDISQTLIPYTHDSTYFRALLVGLTNTLLVAVVGIVAASVLGFTIGIARLSRNWLLARFAAAYIETLRNVPLLLQLLFWYTAVLQIMPAVRASIELPFRSYLNLRGLFIPRPVSEPGLGAVGIALLAAIAAAIALVRWARRRQAATGRPFPALSVGLLMIVALPALVFIATGQPISLEFPVLERFNFQGGIHVLPELLALLLGLSLYTAAFIAEIVRGGILAVPRGQTEAARAVGLRPAAMMRLVILPQAFRVIVPPLTNQYLNLTKNSSLAVAIGYPDLVGVFKNTVLNQTGHALEVIFITMMIYLALSLLTAVLMNWFNKRWAIRER